MKAPKLEPLTVATWAAVAMGLYFVADKFGYFDDEGDGEGEGEGDPVVDPNTIVPLTDPTWTMEQAQTAALAIYGAVYGSGQFWTGQTFENEQAIIDTLLSVNTDGDAALLVEVYGRRSGSWSLSGALTLPATLREYVSASDLQAVNEDYSERGILWNW
jgi:hypothetical protein